MQFFIDFEFDNTEHGPVIISVALVPGNANMPHFYEVAQDTATDPWVQEHVLPILDKPAIGINNLRLELAAYLRQFKEWRFVADWPTDIQLMASLLHDNGGRMMASPTVITFNVVRADYTSTRPHNALADAQSMLAWYKGGGE